MGVNAKAVDRFSFHVREARPVDLVSIIELLKECNLYWPEDDTPEKLETKLWADPDLMLVADVGKVVGFIMASYDGWVAIVWHFGILPQYRSSLMAKLLAEEMGSRLKNRGADIVYALVQESNEKIITFLERRFGFKRFTKVTVVGRKL